MSLHSVLDGSASARGRHPAVIEDDGGVSLDYAGLGSLSDRLRDRLAALGVGRGDRVGIYLRKSADGVASIFGILKSGAAYVPVDPTAPVARNAYIHGDCAVKAVIVERRFTEAYQEELARNGTPLPQMIVLDEVGGGAGLRSALARLDERSPAPCVDTVQSAPEDLAYILYTSGSTGKPKGVMLSHANALSFIDWCSRTFEPRPDDVFSSRAPFHFDLSVLDIYVPLKHGASLVLIGENAGKEPLALSRIISDRRITVWYSAPSILSLIAQFGKIAEHDFSSLRLVLFAGEVFPVVHLRSLKRQVPHPVYCNLYGPTETNVCTWYRIPDTVPVERTDPYPIGRVCDNLAGRVVDAEARVVAPDAEGELCIGRTQRHAGLLGHARADGGELPGGRGRPPLVPDRRHRRAGAGRQLPLRGPAGPHGQAPRLPRRAR